MSPLTLPATIPGLLRRGSPVTSAEGGTGIVFGLPGYDKGRPSLWGICWQFVIHQTDRPPLLDLGDATGRAHAAWWVRSAESATFAPSLVEIEYVDEAARGEPMDATGIAILRRVALRLAIHHYPDHPAAAEWRAALEA